MLLVEDLSKLSKKLNQREIHLCFIPLIIDHELLAYNLNWSVT